MRSWSIPLNGEPSLCAVRIAGPCHNKNKQTWDIILSTNHLPPQLILELLTTKKPNTPTHPHPSPNFALLPHSTIYIFQLCLVPFISNKTIFSTGKYYVIQARRSHFLRQTWPNRRTIKTLSPYNQSTSNVYYSFIIETRYPRNPLATQG